MSYVELHARSAFNFLRGASAPEHLVENIVAALREKGFRELEEVEMVEEDVRFSLPPELAKTAPSQLYGIN